MAGLCEAYWYPLYAFRTSTRVEPRRCGRSHAGLFRPHHGKARAPRRRSCARTVPVISPGVLQELQGRRWRSRPCAEARWQSDQHAARRGRARASIRASVTVSEDPERLFERQWALTLLKRARQRLQRECAAAERRTSSVCSHRTWWAPRNGSLQPPRGAAGHYGRRDPRRPHRFRRKYGLAVRAEIATPSLLPRHDGELRFLLAALERTGPEDREGAHPR